ncbi:hypothetical protein GCE86_11695 [Micromonospora terminaliae]|uniref:Uncharacterized protein n=1 Tax=Micromonospora terminaliae TaxID=1914461 RepID=A0AAJ2ZMF7_9ACTN|nr:hypothetical protein [Micromonospora terminaliae]NES31943.1 hypothetical protein [Micromonospora terminaliae]QGL47633.1 hypothetical protein GCE86_11695 [Micromonospora terminaliae]
MIADDSDAVTVTFLRMMRAELRAERVGEDSLGRTVDLARRWWGAGATADARLAAALRELHGERVDTGDPRQVADAATALAADSGLLTPPDPRGAAVARFAANARRLRNGEITPAEFDEIMSTDEPDRPDA